MIGVSPLASAFGAYILRRRYLRGQGLHFVSIDLTIRRGFRRKTGAGRVALRKVGRL